MNLPVAEEGACGRPPLPLRAAPLLAARFASFLPSPRVSPHSRAAVGSSRPPACGRMSDFPTEKAPRSVQSLGSDRRSPPRSRPRLWVSLSPFWQSLQSSVCFTRERASAIRDTHSLSPAGSLARLWDSVLQGRLGDAVPAFCRCPAGVSGAGPLLSSDQKPDTAGRTHRHVDTECPGDTAGRTRRHVDTGHPGSLQAGHTNPWTRALLVPSSATHSVQGRPHGAQHRVEGRDAEHPRQGIRQPHRSLRPIGAVRGGGRHQHN